MSDVKKVLVAEDSSVIQNLTKKILQLQNCDITGVKDGAQVLNKLEEEHFDVILMDINMPVMDGMECAKKIRAHNDAKIAQTPIIAITGNAKNYSMEEFKEAGIDEFLQKPLNFDQVVEMVQKYAD